MVPTGPKDSLEEHTTPRLHFGTIRYQDLEVLIKTVEEKNLDVLAVQHVHRHARDALIQRLNRLHFQYRRFPELMNLEECDMLFSKFPIVKSSIAQYRKTFQRRCLIKYVLEVEGSQVEVATSSLECNAPIRRQQIEEIGTLLGPCAIFGGNTRIECWQEMTLHEPEGFMDGWKEKGTAANERTQGPDRPDQIWYRGLECRGFGSLPCGVYSVLTLPT